MENASKAIIIAGSVLMGIVVLSLLVAFFNNVRSLQQTKAETESIAKDVEFNKKFEAYNRDVYGSEFLSIAKFIEDYNLREGGENKDYTKIEVYVDIKKVLDAELLKPKEYNVFEFNNAIDDIEKELVTTGYNTTKANQSFTGKNMKQKKAYQLASMTEFEIEEFLGIIDEKNIPQKMKDAIKEYRRYNNLLIIIKRSVFKCTGFEYDQYTGRVTKMKYEL